MDFFARQEDSQARSRRFYRAFSLAIVVAVVIFYLAITGCFLVVAGGIGLFFYHPDPILLLPKSIYGNPPQLFGLRPVLILTVILLASFYKTSAIKKGGGPILPKPWAAN